MASRERLDGLVARHVGAHADDLGTGRLELGDRGVERALLDVGEDDLHALGDEPVGQRPADPRCRARDHGDLACELFHDRSPG